MTTSRAPWLVLSAWIGLGTFVIVVIALHVATQGYDPRSQLMSELALVPHGGLMFVAFAGLGLALAAVAALLRIRAVRWWIALALVLAALCFVAAGAITLDVSIEAHVRLVAMAFVLCGVGMYTLPRSAAAFADLRARVVCWGALAMMGSAAGFGGLLVQPGLAQRLAAMALLAWLAFAIRRLGRPPVEVVPPP